MSIVLLTGPPGSGKSTLAQSLIRQRAQRLTARCAVIEVDDLRQMLVQPHAAPWDGPEGHRQRLLGVRNAAALVRNFHTAGCDVIVADVLTDETASLYRAELAPLDITVVRLVIDKTEGQQRTAGRHYTLLVHEIDWLYEEAASLTEFDRELNTGGSLDDTLRRLVLLLDAGPA